MYFPLPANHTLQSSRIPVFVAVVAVIATYPAMACADAKRLTVQMGAI